MNITCFLFQKDIHASFHDTKACLSKNLEKYIKNARVDISSVISMINSAMSSIELILEENNVTQSCQSQVVTFLNETINIQDLSSSEIPWPINGYIFSF